MAELFWLSDAQWAVIEPFMPKDQPGPARKDDRQIFPRIATRYDKLARNYASALALAAVIAFWC
ncbi:transposase [Methylobacterium sp. WL7]|nr:transposase [Methylobacterium sp. WL7]